MVTLYKFFHQSIVREKMVKYQNDPLNYLKAEWIGSTATFENDFNEELPHFESLDRDEQKFIRLFFSFR